jgi:alkyl hydroperoxide reductase subunit AhpC
VLGVSVDSVYSHKVYADSLGGLWYPLLADFHPKGTVADSYGIMTDEGYSERACFLIDKQGIVRDVEIYERGLPDAVKLIEKLKQL